MQPRFFRRGRDGVVALALTLGLTATAVSGQTGGGFDLTWNAIAGGGGASSGGGFAVDGTVGQADAATLSGGVFTLNGGFWGAFSPGVPIACVGDCDHSGVVTVDELAKMASIELGDALLSDCRDGDRNNDGRITVDEIVAAVSSLLAHCPGS